MKSYFIVLMVVTFGYVQNVRTMSLVEPITAAMLSILTEDEYPKESMCPENYREIEKIKVQAVRLQMQLSSVIQGKLENPHSIQGVEDLIVQHCNNNEDLKKLANTLSEKVENCSIGKIKINSDKLEKLKSDSITKICRGASSMITWNIVNLNIAQGRTPDGKLP